MDSLDVEQLTPRKKKKGIVGWIPHHRDKLRNIFCCRLFIVRLNRFQPVLYRCVVRYHRLQSDKLFSEYLINILTLSPMYICIYVGK